MSTRAVCAVPFGDGWRGRYTHSDGYPTHMVPTYLALVARDGLDAVVKVMTEDHYGWSCVHDTQPDITGVPVPASFQDAGAYLSPSYVAHQFGPGGVCRDGRFVNVPGYGIAYTTKDKQSSPDDWFTQNDHDTPYAYILSPGGLFVLEMEYEPRGWVQRGLVPWGSGDDGSSYEES